MYRSIPNIRDKNKSVDIIKSIAELKNPNKSRAGDLYESFSPSQKEKKQ